jgi:phospholipid/cholesterol/gamma-HCH transport system substrate-binding protein
MMLQRVGRRGGPCDETSNNLNKLLTESTNLVTTIRQDPKKYLTIHMKIF